MGKEQREGGKRTTNEEERPKLIGPKYFWEVLCISEEHFLSLTTLFFPFSISLSLSSLLSCQDH